MMLTDFPNYPRVSANNFIRWNEMMFYKYNNERVYNHPSPLIRFVEWCRVKALLRLLQPINKSDYILAAGCGEGYIESQIKEGKILLIDLSVEAIHRAKSRLSKIPHRDFKVANLENIPTKSRVFDAIECSEVIEHVYNPDKMLNEFYRVLKPRGKFVISFPNEPLINFIKQIFIHLGMFKLFFPNIPKNMTEEWHLRSLDLNRFKEMTGKSWRIEKVLGVPFTWLPIRYVVSCFKKKK